MRIHHIINSFSLTAGGAERLVRSMHLGLRKRDVESFILGLQAHADDDLEFAISLGLRSPYGFKAFNGVRRYVTENVQEGDLVQAHLFPANLYLSLLKQMGMVKAPIVTTEHNTSNRRREHWAGRAIDTVVYGGYGRIFTISEGTERELLRWKPGLHGKTAVVMNGSRLLFDQPLLRKPSSPSIVLSVGSLCKQKNYDTALTALALLNDNDADLDFEYWIAGKGADREALQRQAQALGIAARVKFLGHVDDIKPLLLQADLFLMLSRWEGFGLAAIEAMNASLPLVVSDVPGLREVVVSESSCAILVDPLLPSVIADALRGLLGSRERRISLGMNGFVLAQLFDEERMFDAYLDHYRKVLKHA